MILDAEGLEVGDEGPRVEGRGAGVHGGRCKRPHVRGVAAPLQLLEAVEEREGVLAAAEAEQQAVACMVEKHHRAAHAARKGSIRALL